MDFQLSEEHRIFKETVAAFAAKEIAPIAEEIDKRDEWPEGLWEKLASLGIMGITVDQEYGGAGADILSASLACEELAKASAAVALSWGAHANLCCNNLNSHASHEQKKKYLPPLCSGEHIGALGLTEPGAGSDAVSIQTTARREGDHYVVNGRKTFITNGPIADTIVLYAKTDKNLGPRGITAFILDTMFPGFSVSRKLEKVGNRGSMTGELVLEDCIIPAENVIGKENGGIAVMMGGLDVERAFFATYALGIAEAAFEASVKYARERVQFGKPIAAFQLIQQKVADMYTLIEASRLMCYKAAVLAERAKGGGKGTEVHKIAASAILFAAEAACRICDEAVQIHGGYGYCLEYPVQRYWRDARLGTIGAGTSEMRRLIVAREIFKI
ncbi:MAG TPA: acyl-CoA dehydrogenase family protein [Syntrophales bacterium]|nr:acyl-CoA dehydrogenase family protein [Syntrophales bacterium]HOM07378.1 acyl-CoA dehydrogenase family protein [Syntrophales bacterium]HON98917.1 acyl-CoA dehydrogenase family protein [Syntrophales bacterium]HPC00381.1 acyl-CoA dehydrogenase family protein [Syntrophales bacterium]HPQ06984.1 acyl-CoA dehydrogenase family protein [Syntrophales bacterium]